MIPLVSFLWAAGGSGNKIFRRLVPFTISLAALSLFAPWWLCLLNLVSMLAFMSIPYGSNLQKRVPSWAYFPSLYIIGSLYAASMLPLCFFHHEWTAYGIGVIATGIIFGAMTYGSQKFDFPVWKFVEIALGASLGAVASLLLF